LGIINFASVVSGVATQHSIFLPLQSAFEN
jgi:hypothetical protein